MLLESIESDLLAVRQRRRSLQQMMSLLDDSAPLELPQLISVAEDDHFDDRTSCCSTSTRRWYRQTSEWMNQEDSECTFLPVISKRSRELALKRRSFLQSQKTPQSSNPPEPEPKGPTHPQPQQNAVTRAIVDKIKSVYGSLENYHRQRRETALSYKDLTPRADLELKECTFRPKISHFSSNSYNQRETQPVEGFDSFLKRLEKAREIKIHALTATERKPGCGLIYSGLPTRVQPFSFRSHRVASRE